MDVDKAEQYLIYSSMNTTVRLLDLETLCAKQESLRFEDSSGYGYHGIMSIKFSGDTREILAGTN
jgi:hypothetical protein